MTSSCDYRDDAGAWVLGALADDEAGVFSAHLESCAQCRRDVAELQGVVDILPISVPEALPSPALKSRIMAVVEAEAELLRASGPEADRVPAPAAVRSRPRWLPDLSRLKPLPVLAIACTLVVLGAGAGVLLSDGGPSTTTHRGFGPGSAQVALKVTGHKGELVMDRMPAAPAGKVYEVWLIKGKHKPQPTHALFTVARDGHAVVEIGEDLRGTDHVLVTAEEPGGSDVPTSAPLAGATLS